MGILYISSFLKSTEDDRQRKYDSELVTEPYGTFCEVAPISVNVFCLWAFKSTVSESHGIVSVSGKLSLIELCHFDLSSLNGFFVLFNLVCTLSTAIARPL